MSGVCFGVRHGKREGRVVEFEEEGDDTEVRLEQLHSLDVPDRQRERG